MLKNVPRILSPELLKILCEMGHGDTIVLADANFPAESTAAGKKIVRCDGLGIPDLLDAILRVFPLDRYVAQPVTLMETVPNDPADTSIWIRYEMLLQKHAKLEENSIRRMERFQFYDECRKAYAIVATGETALYANIILQKGVL
jgi:L-fucose mutarotase